MRATDPAARWLWWAVWGLLAANGLVLALLVLPARHERQRQENDLLDLQRRIRTLKRDGETSAVLLAALREADEFTQGYPRRADLVGLIGRITKLARSLAVEVPTVEYRPSEVKEADLTKITILMGVEGTYGKIRRFLHDLEGMRRFLVIERVSLRDLKGTSELQMQLQLAAYLR